MLLISDTVAITKRESEILALLADGLTGREIATWLHVSNHTIESHRKNMMVKMGARNTVHLVVKAVRMGII